MRIFILMVLFAGLLFTSAGSLPYGTDTVTGSSCLAPKLEGVAQNVDGKVNIFELTRLHNADRESEYILSTPESGTIKIIVHPWMHSTYQVFLEVYDENTDEFVSLMQMFYNATDRELEMHEVYFGVRSRHKELLAKGKMSAAMRFCAKFVVGVLFADNGPYTFTHHGTPNMKLLSIFARLLDQPDFSNYTNRSHKYPAGGTHWFRSGFLDGTSLELDSTGNGLVDTKVLIHENHALPYLFHHEAVIEFDIAGKQQLITCHVVEDEAKIVFRTNASKDVLLVYDKNTLRASFYNVFEPEKKYRMIFMQADKMIFMKGLMKQDLEMPDYAVIDVTELMRAA